MVPTLPADVICVLGVIGPRFHGVVAACVPEVVLLKLLGTAERMNWASGASCCTWGNAPSSLATTRGTGAGCCRWGRIPMGAWILSQGRMNNQAAS